MNKYENALKSMCNGCVVALNGDCDRFNIACYAYRALKELVDKATPKKPKGYYASVPHYRCPNCNCEAQLYSDSTKYPYCHYCGQKLDWSKEDE